MVVHPLGGPEPMRCHAWCMSLLGRGGEIRVPDIADYELRRELLRLGKGGTLLKLDSLRSAVGALAISSEVLRKAAEFWADARSRGQPTAPDLALDGDVILAAQARVLAIQTSADVIIATTNVGHLSRYAPAVLWDTIE